MRLQNLETGVTISVETLPGRKNPCLCVETPGEFKKYATFKNDIRAFEFMEILSEFCGARSRDDSITSVGKD